MPKYKGEKMFQEICVIDKNNDLTEELKILFKDEENLEFKNIAPYELEYIYKNLPQLVVINDDAFTDIDSIELCKKIRKNPDNNITPIIVLSSNEDKSFMTKSTSVANIMFEPILCLLLGLMSPI